uniref:Sulfide quinone oxidoreductase n=1 Tax=Canis lupus familiaris TaxID=9615 RepID=A0A8I3Q5I4_CANLF
KNGSSRGESTHSRLSRCFQNTDKNLKSGAGLRRTRPDGTITLDTEALPSLAAHQGAPPSPPRSPTTATTGTTDSTDAAPRPRLRRRQRGVPAAPRAAVRRRRQEEGTAGGGAPHRLPLPSLPGATAARVRPGAGRVECPLTAADRLHRLSLSCAQREGHECSWADVPGRGPGRATPRPGARGADAGQNQVVLLDTLEQEISKFKECHSMLDINALFTEAKHYHAKLVNIRKEMLMLHEKTSKLKKRALKLQQKRQKEELEREQQREKEFEREKQLTAKLAKRT